VGPQRRSPRFTERHRRCGPTRSVEQVEVVVDADLQQVGVEAGADAELGIRTGLDAHLLKVGINYHFNLFN
jgi:hypothetical protein